MTRKRAGAPVSAPRRRSHPGTARTGCCGGRSRTPRAGCARWRQSTCRAHRPARLRRTLRRVSGDRPGQEGLPAARRAVKEQPAGQAPPVHPAQFRVAHRHQERQLQAALHVFHPADIAQQHPHPAGLAAGAMSATSASATLQLKLSADPLQSAGCRPGDESAGRAVRVCPQAARSPWSAAGGRPRFPGRARAPRCTAPLRAPDRGCRAAVPPHAGASATSSGRSSTAASKLRKTGGRPSLVIVG